MQGHFGSRAPATALLIAAVVVGVTIRYNAFVPWATDSGAYIAAAHGWAAADLFSPSSFVFWAPWDSEGHVESPLGHRPGPSKGTITGLYPLGYPVLLAAALKLAGPLAPYVVSPLLAGVLAWCAFILGSRLSTSWAGVIAAMLIAATPVTLWHAVIPMSDVPAVAFWAISWVMSLRGGLGAAAASGCAAALAIMIRPNLAPLGIVIAASVIAAERSGSAHAVKRLLVLGWTASIGLLVVLWSQAVLYGHALQPGYGGFDDFFRVERIPQNARLYPRLLLGLHSWLVAGGLLMVPLTLKHTRRSPAHHRAAVIAFSAVGLIAINYALYLPYLTYEGWHWLRFLLPAMLALFVLFAGALDRARLWLMARQRWAGAIAILPALVVALTPQREIRPTDGYPRLLLMGHYLREALPERAAVLTYTHGGALATYTGRPIVRLDLIPPDSLDAIISQLQRRGHRPVLVLDVAVEGSHFTDRFKTSQYARLDWPPRAEFASGFSVTYHDPQDRDRFLNGERWATDVLASPLTSPTLGSWSSLRAPLERVIFPAPEESFMFKTALEATYRDALGRQAMATSTDPRTWQMWMRRYLRYRVHRCDHQDAAAKVFRQLAGAGVQPLCGRPETVTFPPRNETVAFGLELDAKLRNGPPLRVTTTFVDAEGDAVWLQEYLLARVASCSHHEAIAAVLAQIEGMQTPAPCGAR